MAHAQKTNPPNETVTHALLVQKAVEWLGKNQRCSVVISEMTTNAGETPDAIGWRNSVSVLVECKVSRADFLRDRQKFFRRDSASGMGDYRYFLTRPGIINSDDVPQDWGLLVLTDDGRVKTLVESSYFESSNHGSEKLVLLSTIRRIGSTAPIGVSVKCYSIDSKNRATLGVKEPDKQ